MAFKGLTLIVCTLKQTETSHPTSKFSKISTSPQTVGQNPPVFFVCLNDSPTFTGVIYLNWLLGNVWSLRFCPHQFSWEVYQGNTVQQDQELATFATSVVCFCYGICFGGCLLVKERGVML